MSLTPVPPGQIATVVTSLEMTAPPRPQPIPASPLQLRRWASPDPVKYRALFRRVGEPWLWFSRLVMEDAELCGIIGDQGVEIYAITDPRGVEVGIIELDFRETATAELSFLGLVPELAGKGHGRWLMARTLALAWRTDIKRVWVHTCTLDHPSALGFYRAQGFLPFARAVEIFADPRLAGVLSREAAPHAPVLSSRR